MSLYVSRMYWLNYSKPFTYMGSLVLRLVLYPVKVIGLSKRYGEWSVNWGRDRVSW